MDNFHVYKDIEARTGGEIYIGVVGPVRTGKSTFIKRAEIYSERGGGDQPGGRNQCKDSPHRLRRFYGGRRGRP